MLGSSHLETGHHAQALADENAPRPGEGAGLSRYLDAFLHPRNIQWLLVAGVLILLASSLMLVSANWQGYTPAWKYLILLGYTAGTWVVGRWSHSRLGLRRTGTVILSLAVLLLPVSFLGLNLVGMTGPPWAGLLLINVALAGVAARDVFRHFLHGDHPTFLACYLLLSTAGAFIAADMSTAGAAAVALALWAAFAVGAVKVNRHVFWLGEEHRRPRVFGFFPVLLLGCQFLVLYALGPARHLPVQWMGLGCALVAAIVLTTADAVARVFQQRTGDLVRPLPWAVVGPLVAGLAMCGVALCLAGTGLTPPGRPYAVVPTAVLVTCLLALVARRTGKVGFAWAALVVATIAYNFSPVFFTGLARAAISHGASAVRESRLPYPFYGLTYLPLLAALLGLGALARRRGWALVAGPVRGFALGLACTLLAVSLGHPKAIFPVAAAMIVVLAAHASTFRDRAAVLPAVVAWVVAAAGLCTFLRGVLGMDLPSPAAEMLALAAAAMTLLVPGFLVDRLFERRLRSNASATVGAGPWPDRVCQLASLCLSVGLSVAWITLFIPTSPAPLALLAAGAISALLLAHGVRWLEPVLSTFAICTVHVMTLRWGIGLDLTIGTVVSVATLALVVQWLAAGVLQHRRPAWRVTRALAGPARRVASIELATLLAAFVLPAVWAHALTVDRPVPATWQPSTLVAMILVTWGCDAARGWSSRGMATAACVAAFGCVGAMLVDVTGGNKYLLAVLAATAITGMGVAEWLTRRAVRHVEGADELASPSRAAGWRVLADAATVVSLVTLGGTAITSLIVYDTSVRVAGLVAAVGLCLVARLRRLPVNLRTIALALVNWQALAMVLAALLPETVTWARWVSADHIIAASLPLAALAAASVLAWQRFGRGVDDRVGRHQRTLLRAMVAGCLVASLGLAAHGPADVLLAGATLLAMVGSEWWAACRYRTTLRAWTGEVLVLAAVAYFMAVGVIQLGSGLSLYAPLAAALALQGAARVARRRPTTAILAGPFSQTSLALPMATVALAVARGLHTPHAGWLGTSSLSLFLVAGFYFWRGVERRQPRWHVLAAAVANVALALLWHDLRLDDPQFYMVPLGASVLLLVQVLKRELPAATHDPLRYLGALLVLVSPAFHIVGGSWLHLLTLMLLSLAVMLAAMALRVRAMLYAGTAFLVADLVAMVVRGSIDQPSVLWIAGLAVGAGVLALGALAERNREQLLQRVRTVSAALAVWD